MTDDETTSEATAAMTEAPPPPSRPSPPARRTTAALLWLLASLAIMLSSVAVWAHQTLLTADGWGGIVGDVIAQPEVTDEIAGVVVTRVSDTLGVQNTVAGFLPGALDIVAGALTSSVEDRITDTVADFMAGERFQEAFVNANTVGHEVAMAAIRSGDTEALTSQGGLITLNIFPIIETVLSNLQGAGIIDADREIPELADFEPPTAALDRLERLLGRDLPDDIGTVVLVESENLALIQDVVRNFDIITLLLLLLAIVFVALALWLSASRVRMVLWLAGGAIAALAIGRFFTRLVLNAITARAQEGDSSVTARAVVDTAVDSAMWFTFGVMAIAAIVALAAILWERRQTGERAPQETPPRTLGHWARDNALTLLYIALGVIAFMVIWNVGGADLALLTAAGLGLVGVAYKLLSADDATGDEGTADPPGAG